MKSVTLKGGRFDGRELIIPDNPEKRMLDPDGSTSENGLSQVVYRYNSRTGEYLGCKVVGERV